jgi:hypothetical protein
VSVNRARWAAGSATDACRHQWSRLASALRDDLDITGPELDRFQAAGYLDRADGRDTRSLRAYLGRCNIPEYDKIQNKTVCCVHSGSVQRLLEGLARCPDVVPINNDHQMAKPNKRMASETKELLKLLNKHACFRYRIDGETEFDRTFHEALDEVFGPEPNSAYNRWVRNLRRNGLIP